MLLDIVSVFRPAVPSHVHHDIGSVLDRIFATSIVGALYSLASPGYVLLAKEFNVSVDEIASSFSAFPIGIAIFTYVGPV